MKDAARADRPFESVDDLWRRADVPVASLVQLAEADAMHESLELARDEMAHSSPVILIVEDELLLRIDSAEMIENAGFEVVEARNADEAIAILQARPAVHVVFSDIQMPGSTDGLKLARFVQDLWPPIKIVATSGHGRVGALDLPAGSVFLPKPYRGALLVATLRAMTSAAA